ncbi:MAG: hypothetical protein ACLGI9_02830, partial [Thermoanaerobaculia bacterium]
AALILLVFLVASPAAATSSYVSGDSLWQWLVDMLLPDDPEGGEERPVPGQNGDGDAGIGIDPNGVKVFGVIGEPRADAGPAVR